jgi:hypothetical protein
MRLTPINADLYVFTVSHFDSFSAMRSYYR